MTSTTTRTPIVWDQQDPVAWERNMLAETQRHRDALTAQWPSDMRIGYFHGQTHMVPADQPTPDVYSTIVPLCGTEFVYGMTAASRVEAAPCRICTQRYNEGATTGVKPDPFPVGTSVEFEVTIGDRKSTMKGVVVERTPAFRGYRRVQVNPAGLCTEVRVENMTVVQ